MAQEAAALSPGHADCPRSGPWGKSPPARCPPARAAPLPQSGDMTTLCRVLTPSPRSPRSAPGGSALHSRPPGKPQKTQETQLVSAIAPQFNSTGLGPLTVAPGLRAVARAPAFKPESPGELREPFISSSQPKGEIRESLRLGPLSGLGLPKPVRVNVNFANQAFPEARASSRSAPSLPSSRHARPPSRSFAPERQPRVGSAEKPAGWGEDPFPPQPGRSWRRALLAL